MTDDVKDSTETAKASEWSGDGAEADETELVPPAVQAAAPTAWEDYPETGSTTDLDYPRGWRDRLAKSSPVLFAIALVTVVIAIAGFLWIDHHQPVSHTVTTVTVAAPPPPSPDDRFIAELADQGISAGNLSAANHYFMQLAHYICYRLLPPEPQPREPEVDTIVKSENKNVDDGGHMMRFSRADGEHLVDAAINVYCPQATRS